MSSVNKVILIGNLGADPETRHTQDGKPIVNMRVATSESWRDRNSGERREKTEWHSVVIFSEGLCKVAGEYLRKGSKVYIEGQLQTRKWQDRDGNDRYSTEVVLQGFNASLVMLDGKPDGQQERRYVGDTSSQYSVDNPPHQQRPVMDNTPSFARDSLNDEVPF